MSAPQYYDANMLQNSQIDNVRYQQQDGKHQYYDQQQKAQQQAAAAAVPQQQQQQQAAPRKPASTSAISAPQAMLMTPSTGDDLHRFHTFKVNASNFIVDSHYMPVKTLGHGAYGVVCSAVDTRSNTKIAIKKISKAYDDLIDAKRILREMKLLATFHHEHIVGLRDLIPPPKNMKFDDIYIVLDYMETDLHKIIYSKNELTDEHIQYFLYQILNGLKYIHASNVIHRDLKPSNLLLNGNCDLKICDFGLARGVNTETDYELTEYVVTRWYRAPEVMCAVQEYDSKIDVWSVGCILAELLARKPLFPGDDYIKQMNLIFRTLGTPSSSDMKFITNDKAREYISNLRKQPKIPFSQLFPHANPQCIDLLDKMLQFNPHKRISVEDALQHPYLRNLASLSQRSAATQRPPVPFDFTFENIELTKENIQQLVWNEICQVRPECQSRDWRTDAEIVAANAARVAAEQKQQQAAQMAALNNSFSSNSSGYDNDSRRSSLSHHSSQQHSRHSSTSELNNHITTAITI